MLVLVLVPALELVPALVQALEPGQVLEPATAQDEGSGEPTHPNEHHNEIHKIFSLILLAGSLASGVLHAKGGGGNGNDNGSMTSHGSAQHTQTRDQYRVETRTRSRDGDHSGWLRQISVREQTRVVGTPFSGQ